VSAASARPLGARALLAIPLLLLAAGCAPLPTAQPFVDATRQYRASLASGGAVLEQQLAEAGGADAATRFAGQWETRVRAADALVSYSKAIAAVADSGGRGAESAQRIADSAQTLAGAVGLTAPGAAAAVATDTAAFIYAQIAAARAARSLADALTQAQPAVERIAGIMAKDLADAETLLRAAVKLRETELARAYNTEMAFYASLLDERAAIYRKPRRTGADETRLLELEQLIQATQSWRAPMQAESAALAERLRTGRQLVAASRQALSEWSAAHADLAAAVQAGRGVDATSLVAATEEMRELIGRMRAL
jgi:uncharacterized protein YoaH (UPF0181 family)